MGLAPEESTSLRQLPPIERFRRASELMAETQDRLWELADIRAKAMRELHRTMTRVEIAAALDLRPGAVHRIIRAKWRRGTNGPSDRSD